MSEPTATSSLLLNAKQAAELCGCSERTWRAWDAAGLTPQPMHIGRSIFWRPTELQQWVDAGCPDRKTWTSRRT